MGLQLNGITIGRGREMPSNTSRIEQIIYEMEEFLDSCKEHMLNKSVIMVNREKMEDLIRDLKASTPEEIKRYQKIIANKDAILADAKERAEALIQNATEQTKELLSENQIMIEAYARADEIIRAATSQAQDIIDNATLEANSVKDIAANYMDDVLAHLETIINASTKEAISNYDTLIGNLDRYSKIIESNRKELHPDEEMVVSSQAVGAGEADEEV